MGKIIDMSSFLSAKNKRESSLKGSKKDSKKNSMKDRNGEFRVASPHSTSESEVRVMNQITEKAEKGWKAPLRNRKVKVKGQAQKGKRAQKGRKSRIQGQAQGVIDFKKEKSYHVAQERRRARRTVLSRFIGTYLVIPERGLGKVDFYDISQEGLAFDALIDYGQFKEGERVHLRVYLSKDQYFSFDIEIRHVRLNPENACYRYGAIFANHAEKKDILLHFVRFVEEFSQHMQRDYGDKIISSFY